jgi:two-component system sensor histidine kinase DesK
MSPRRPWHRHASVLLWTPLLLLGPLLDLPDSGLPLVEAALLVVVATTAVAVALTGGSDRPLAYVALSTQVAATFAGSMHGSEWLPTWILLALTLPCVLRGRWLAVLLAAVTAASMWAAWAVEPHSAARVWTEGFVVLLAGVAHTAVTRLIDTIAELRRTREELARRAVADERERFSRDLHDLLGHTLSLMVVKAEAVRRLVATDPEAAAGHAADIERVGREALTDVRAAVEATRVPSLGEELDGARLALDAAGITAEITADLTEYADTLPPQSDQALAWVVREAVTNVLRHSGARRCRLEVAGSDERLVLTVADDGVGGPLPQQGRGGLAGLQRRLAAAGGGLCLATDADGFRLDAWVPGPEVVP